jgi:hypothetical protein
MRAGGLVVGTRGKLEEHVRVVVFIFLVGGTAGARR